MEKSSKDGEQLQHKRCSWIAVLLEECMNILLKKKRDLSLLQTKYKFLLVILIEKILRKKILMAKIKYRNF